MRVLILEDEVLVAKDITTMLLALEPTAVVVGTISSVEAARNWLATHPLPDLILSDIHLSDGISLTLFESLPACCPIIFTTAFDTYAIRAFKVNSIDYLLKPVDRAELALALAKYKSVSVESHVGSQLKNLLETWGQTKKYKERFLALHRHALVPVLQDDIAFFHKEELIYVHTLANERLISEHHTLDEIEELLNPAIFFRVNRQYIIHVQTVSRIKTTHKGLTIQLKAPFTIEIDISREKANAFKQWVG